MRVIFKLALIGPLILLGLGHLNAIAQETLPPNEAPQSLEFQCPYMEIDFDPGSATITKAGSNLILSQMPSVNRFCADTNLLASADESDGSKDPAALAMARAKNVEAMMIANGRDPNAITITILISPYMPSGDQNYRTVRIDSANSR